jgi:3-oxoadipate enol-lactonase
VLPPGRHLALPGRGTTFIREIPGPGPEAPVLFLLHGWTATADLNWFTCYAPLAEKWRVVAIDHRGHGRGIRTTQRFSLADCADDVAAVADLLDIPTFVPVGYSMGGTIAQLVWRRHPDRVRGLVLAATAAHFVEERAERAAFLALTGIGALARLSPRPVREWVSDRLYLSRKTMTWEPWAAQQLAQHEWRMILEAGSALGHYDARPWLPEVDVPTGIVITTRDGVVDTERQRLLGRTIPRAQVFEVDGNHDAVFARADQFVPALQAAVEVAVVPAD